MTRLTPTSLLQPGNAIGDDGCEALAVSLQNNSTLTMLNLSGMFRSSPSGLGRKDVPSL